jgi:glycosidase
LKKAAGRNQYLVEEAWPTTFLENHDSSRCISRHGDESHWEESGKLFAILTTTLSGTIFVYQGQEIGMLNFPDTWTIDDLEDIEAHNLYKEVKKRTNEDPEALKSVMDNLRAFGRDNNRTPMQWDGSINGGFTTGKPWLKVNPNYRDINVEKQSWDPYSILAFYRHMLRFRKQYADSLIRGKYKEIYTESEDIFCYFKQGEMTTLFVAMNFTDKTQPLVLPQHYDDDNGKNLTYRLLLTSVTGHVDGNLQPYEGAIYLVT